MLSKKLEIVTHGSTNMGAEKTTIMVLVCHYLPGYKSGGPIRSIAGLIDGLQDEFDFKVICGDRDFTDKQPFESEPVGRWYRYGSAEVLRVPPGPRGARMIVGALRKQSYDVLYINGVWPRAFSILPLLCRKIGLLPRKPIVLQPRGDWSDGALSIKPLRKRLYLAFARITGLFDGLIWQASNESEKRDILKRNGRVVETEHERRVDNLRRIAVSQANLEIVVAPDMTDAANSVEGRSRKSVSDLNVVIVPNVSVGPQQVEWGHRPSLKVAGELRVVSLARVCRMKNIDFGIRVLKHVRGRVHYDIFGPLEEVDYVAKCRQLCEELPENVTVRFMGGIPHATVTSMLNRYQVFLHPSLGENFGHVIFEAMLVGCVPLISDQTLWRNLEEFSAGWDLPLSSPEAFANAIEEAVAWSEEEFQIRSHNAREYAIDRANPAESIRKNRLLFEVAAQRRE